MSQRLALTLAGALLAACSADSDPAESDFGEAGGEGDAGTSSDDGPTPAEITACKNDVIRWPTAEQIIAAAEAACVDERAAWDERRETQPELKDRTWLQTLAGCLSEAARTADGDVDVHGEGSTCYGRLCGDVGQAIMECFDADDCPEDAPCSVASDWPAGCVDVEQLEAGRDYWSMTCEL
ncbi:MAG: hypothetical protein AAF721_21400 [Myxococcota bacterium]